MKTLIIAAAMLMTVSAQAIDDDLAGGYARIVRLIAIDDNLAGGYSSLGSRMWAGGLGAFWANWWGNATGSFGHFTPIPRNRGMMPTNNQ